MFGLDSIWHWLILLALALLLFGAGKLRHAGRDLGSAIAGFRQTLRQDPPTAAPGSAPGEVGPNRRP